MDRLKRLLWLPLCFVILPLLGYFGAQWFVPEPAMHGPVLLVLLQAAMFFPAAAFVPRMLGWYRALERQPKWQASDEDWHMAVGIAVQLNVPLHAFERSRAAYNGIRTMSFKNGKLTVYDDDWERHPFATRRFLLAQTMARGHSPVRRSTLVAALGVQLVMSVLAAINPWTVVPSVIVVTAGGAWLADRVDNRQRWDRDRAALRVTRDLATAERVIRDDPAAVKKERRIEKIRQYAAELGLG